MGRAAGTNLSPPFAEGICESEGPVVRVRVLSPQRPRARAAAVEQRCLSASNPAFHALSTVLITASYLSGRSGAIQNVVLSRKADGSSRFNSLRVSAGSFAAAAVEVVR